MLDEVGGSSRCRSGHVRAQLTRRTTFGSRPGQGKTGLAHAPYARTRRPHGAPSGGHWRTGERGLDGQAHARVSCLLRPRRARAAHPASLGCECGVLAGRWPNSNEHPSALVGHD
eukprot:scaffold1644_cov357-Prasinococcus_capsulatus_cf.AAC.9